MKLSQLSLVVLAAVLSAWASAQELVCPVNLDPVVEGGPVVEYKGVRYEFCCPGCDVKFAKNPEKYLQANLDQGQVIGTFLFDPVSGKRVESEAGKFMVDYNHIRYFFESEKNREEFAELPEVYAQVPSKESMTCAVKKTKIAKAEDAAGYADFEGVRYYFCCSDCPEVFALDPAKYASSVSSAVRVVGGKGEVTASGHRKLAPTCAGCAGEARLLGANGKPAAWTFSYRYVGIGDVKSRHRFSVDHMITGNLSVGLERSASDASALPVSTLSDGLFSYLKNSDGDAPILPRASWFATPEGKSFPSVTIGFASDRLSTPRGQAFFATFGHSIPGTPVTPFVSVKTNSFGGRTVFPFGANVYFGDGWAVQAINDGDYSHMLISKIVNQTSISLLYARTQYWGLAVSYGF